MEPIPIPFPRGDLRVNRPGPVPDLFGDPLGSPSRTWQIPGSAERERVPEQVGDWEQCAIAMKNGITRKSSEGEDE